MKKILKLSLITTCLIGLTSCGDGLNKYRRNGQYIELDYLSLNEKLVNDDSFIFFLTKDGCPGCKNFYPIVADFLSQNDDKTIYMINESKMEATDKLTLASYYSKTLGQKYFEENDRSSMVLWTPSICKVENGEFVYAQIGNISIDSLSYIYQDNYLSFDLFYMLNSKASINKETFNIFISTVADESYDSSLRQYFLENTDCEGYYLNASQFDEEDDEKLLNRINYYLGEGNEIETLPDYCLLQYEKGVIKNYDDSKYDTTKLDILYGKTN